MSSNFLKEFEYILPNKINQKIITNNTKSFIIKWKYLIEESQKYISTFSMDSLTIKLINRKSSINQIPIPNILTLSSIPIKIKEYIYNDIALKYIVHYETLINKKKINIYFILPDSIKDIKKSTFEKGCKLILQWIYIIQQYGSIKCSNTLSCYFYLTPFLKTLEEITEDNKKGKNINQQINEYNVNSAFTYTCQKNGEIVIYREEEWFKVFIHETMHSFGLDFSNIGNNIDNITIKSIKSIFPGLNSGTFPNGIRLYESYTEYYAELIHCIFCSVDKNNINNINNINNTKQIEKKIIKHILKNIDIERYFSVFQMVKILKKQGFTYNNLLFVDPYKKLLYLTEKNISIPKWYETTAIFSYFIGKTILLFNYQYFIEWCKENNINILQFQYNRKTIINFYNFIEDMSQELTFLDAIQWAENILYNMNDIKYKNTRIYNTTRMSIMQ